MITLWPKSCNFKIIQSQHKLNMPPNNYLYVKWRTVFALLQFSFARPAWPKISRIYTYHILTYLLTYLPYYISRIYVALNVSVKIQQQWVASIDEQNVYDINPLLFWFCKCRWVLGRLLIRFPLNQLNRCFSDTVNVPWCRSSLNSSTEQLSIGLALGLSLGEFWVIINYYSTYYMTCYIQFYTSGLLMS